jgi:hypothetical protein
MALKAETCSLNIASLDHAFSYEDKRPTDESLTQCIGA